MSATIETGLITPGDVLTEIDPTISVEAFVTSDSTVLVNGQVFDSLDSAAEAAGALNLTGMEFWAKLVDGEPVSLQQLSEELA
jgi:hypothetical protein